MAEVLGTVVGVVSLGLQVCAGINNYLDGLQCRKEDLEYTERCCKSMEALLKQVESLKNRLPETTDVRRASIEGSMAVVKTELSLLDEFIRKVCTNNPSSSSKSVKERIRDRQRKLLYPFRKDHLCRLNDRLETANGALRSTLQLAELELSLKLGKSLQGLQANTASLTHGVSDMQLEIRQLHSDTSASHLALARMENKSDQATSILSLSHQEIVSSRDDLAEIKVMLAALTASDGRAILPKLVSKPDALRTVSEIAGNGSSEYAPDPAGRYYTQQHLKGGSYSGFQCICKPRRVSESKRRRIGLAFMEQERVKDNVHAPRCPLARFPSPSNDQWSFGISVKTLKRNLRAALTISMSANFGAGGFGLAPSFTYFPVREDSPAFRVLYLLQDAFCPWVWSDEGADFLFRRAINTLQVTMTAGKWSPFDIDGEGRSLLNVCSAPGPSISSSSTWQGHQMHMFAFLLNLGVPRDKPDVYGSFPFHLQAWDPDNRQFYAQSFDLLWPDDLITIPPDRKRHLLQDYVDVEIMEDYMFTATASKKMKELYENHLLQAVIKKSKSMLLDIIDKGLITSELSDMDTYGYRMWHYLVGWPEGLRTVLEQCGNSVLRLCDQSNISLLECALKWSGRICTGSQLECCFHKCTCAESVKLILEAESEDSLRLTQHEHWVLAMSSASFKARDLAIDDLRCRRHELKELGLRYLSSKQIDRMDLGNSQVLDYHTAEVLTALKASGIIVPPRLETEFKSLGGLVAYGVLSYGTGDLAFDGPFSSRAASVYHILGASPNTGDTKCGQALASSLYSKGFRDVDVPNCAGLTPLAGKCSYAAQIPQNHMRWNWGTSIEYWLIEHGASLQTQVPRRVTGYTVTHHVFMWTGFQSGFTRQSSPFRLIHSSWESKGGFTKKALDVCRCNCSIGGCNPYNILWKMLLQRFQEGWMKAPHRRPAWFQRKDKSDLVTDDRSDSTMHSRQRLISFVLEQTLLIEEACELPRFVKSICLRACTFEVLPLRHTCCEEGRRRCDDDEIGELWEEDETEICRLEGLIVEFEEKLEEMDCGLAEFYRAYWIDRMNEVLRQMDEQFLTASEIEDAERVGVKLTVGAVADEGEKTEVANENSLEYWVQKIDQVAA